MGRLIDADEYEKRIKPYDTEDVMDKALYNFSHTKLLSTPTARPNGKWIESTESRFRPFMCSICGCIYDVDTVMGNPIWNFCPNCGSDNREVE